MGAQIFFWARLTYFPVYLAGLRYVRTAAWLVGVLGIAVVVLAALSASTP